MIRMKALDSLRGIAALVVVLHHIRLMYSETPGWIKYSPLRALFSGESAVIVFFVLSGFVLYFALNSKNPGSFWSFANKRFWRIYPAFCVAILASTALWYFVDPSPVSGLSDWAKDLNWQLRPTFSVVMGHLAMTDVEALYSLDNVMWSLVIELRLSLLFPLIAMAVKRDWRVACLASIVVSVACAYLEGQLAAGWPFNPFHTGRYLYLFVIGATLAEKSGVVRRVVQGLNGWNRLGLWCSALVLFSTNPAHVGGVPAAIGSALLVALAFADSKVEAALSTPIPLWLGKVSYSLYLIHVPILIAAAHLLIGTMPMIQILALAGATALCASEIFYRLIELPSIKIGRLMAEKISPQTVSPKFA